MKKIFETIENNDYNQFCILLTEYDKSPSQSKENYNELLGAIIAKGNIPFAKFILTSPELSIHANIVYGTNTLIDNHKKPVVIACKHGQLEMLKFLLKSPELKEHATYKFSDYSDPMDVALEYCHTHILKFFIEEEGHHIDWTGFLGNAAFSNSVPAIHYLLTSKELKVNANIHWMSDIALSNAAYKGSFETVEFLTRSEKITDHINDPSSYYEALLQCVNQGLMTTEVKERCFDIFKYLFTTAEELDIKVFERMDSDRDHHMLLGNLCNQKLYNYLTFLICETSFSKTKNVTEYLEKQKNTSNHDVALYIDKLFGLRELNKKLHTELKPVYNNENPNIKEKTKLKI